MSAATASHQNQEHVTDTIFALSSAPGRAGIAVIRLSGPAARDTLIGLTGRDEPEPRRARRATLRDPQSQDPLDDGLVLWFPGPRSYTGEDVVELHIHGGRAVVGATVDCLGRQAGLRLAEPGEFTRRAFENGRLDLTAAEAIADLIDAETDAQRRQALRQADGALATLYEDWRTRIIKATAWLEADIDFPDEDLPGGLPAKVAPEIAALVGEIESHLEDDRRGERLRDGFYIAIIGAPNAGKSSLLNRIARRDAAIVSATAGTTRDVIETHLDLAGYPVIIADTAGLRAVDLTDEVDPIEAEGVRRALDRAATADLKIAVFDAGEALDQATLDQIDPETLIAINKIDAAPAPSSKVFGKSRTFHVSAKTGVGLDSLIKKLAIEVQNRLAVGPAPVITRARHRTALEECLRALRGSRKATLPELAAEDMRLAVRALGRITGRVDVEDLLDVIFRDFCIGK